jgi:tripartite-type tricarboxylate transporter receptor subunit TctC
LGIAPDDRNTGGDRLMTKTAPLFLLVAFLAISTSLTSAQDYPSRPIELVVPFPAGGGTEIVSRLVADGLAKRLGQPFVVLNRPGANTNVGTLAVVRSKPDGHTLLITSFGLAANPSLYKKLAFDPQTDLEPITLIANTPTVLTVPLPLPVNSLTEFIAYAKARPGELNYATMASQQPAPGLRAVPEHDRHQDGAHPL